MSANSNLYALRGARAVSEFSQWEAPYPWTKEGRPFGAVSFSARDSIAAPALATQTLVCSYTVPQGMWGVFTSFLCRYIGSGFVEGSGDITYAIDINKPISVTLTSGHSVPYYGNIITNLGSFEDGPWPIDGHVILRDGDELRLKVTINNAAIGVGAPNYVHGALNGWVWDAKRQDR